jgi:DNA-binding transcriptional regulator YhcF (GntR family)
MGKLDRKGRRKGDSRHARLYEYIETTDAWRNLSGIAAKAWMTIGLMHNGSNNGAIGVSSRELGKRIGVHHSVAARAIIELENAGFLRCTKASSFSLKRLAAQYRLTHLRNDVTGETPTREFARAKKSDSDEITEKEGALT